MLFSIQFFFFFITNLIEKWPFFQVGDTKLVCDIHSWLHNILLAIMSDSAATVSAHNYMVGT